MLIVYISMLICRCFGPSWMGPSLLVAEIDSYLIMHVIRSGVVLDSFKISEYDQEIPHSQSANKPVAS